MSNTGGLEGASRTSREMMTWQTSPQPMEALLRYDKEIIDGRARDVFLNNGYISGAINIHRDNIVGSQFRLNSRPDMGSLGIEDEGWSQEFQNTVESLFNSYGESDRNWFDASGYNDFVALIRQAVGMFVIQGEVLAAAEWKDEPTRPFATCVQLFSSARLCNPFDVADTSTLRNGIELDRYGKPVAYHIRKAAQYDVVFDEQTYQWRRVPLETKWGRKQMIHIIDQTMPNQLRGVSEMVAVLKQIRMMQRYQDVELQQAILQATYAATIESDLPAATVAEIMGAGAAGSIDQIAREMMLSQGMSPNKNIQLDGVRVAQLYPGTKLNLQAVSQPTGIGGGFEKSLLRGIAAGVNVSYEQLARDYSQTNYSSARASMNETYKFMLSRKRLVADKFASCIFRLWLEEAIARKDVPLPPGKNRAWVYSSPLILDALSRASWIGAPRGQIDEMKETQASILKIKSGLSTYEIECARVGMDWREVLRQRNREEDFLSELGLTVSDGAEKPIPSKKETTNDKKEDDDAVVDEDKAKEEDDEDI